MVKADDGCLQARARFLSDPPLWCWEIVDAASGAVVASSWQSDWQAYESPNEALREAAPALVDLTRRRLGGDPAILGRGEGITPTGRTSIHSLDLLRF